MDNLKSAEAAKREILERIAKKLAVPEEKTEVSAVSHSNYRCKTRGSWGHGNTRHGNAGH